jgi:hypothetical protein
VSDLYTHSTVSRVTVWSTVRTLHRKLQE